VSPDNKLKELAERIDESMREHAYSHQISNNPNSFYCSSSCVSQQLQIVVEREARPLVERGSTWVFRMREYAGGVVDRNENCAEHKIEVVSELMAQRDHSKTWIYFFADLDAVLE
jgi:hypothetical protein